MTPQREGPEAKEATTCPYCAEAIKPAAQVCPHCRKRIPQYDPNGRRKIPARQAVIIIAVVLLLIIGLAVFALHREDQNTKRHAKARACEIMREIGQEGDDC